jgi:hypothetical protein
MVFSINIYTMKRVLTLLFTLAANLLFAQADTAKKAGGSAGNPVGHYVGRGTVFSKYELQGRTLLNNPFTDSIANQRGRIVLQITVDSAGNVIDVNGPARGSTTMDAVLLERSKAAAYKAKFSPVDSLHKQMGKMSFNYYIK